MVTKQEALCVFLVSATCIILQVAADTCSVSLSPSRVAIANGYVHVEFNREHPQIDVLLADYTGSGSFNAAANLLANGQDSLNRAGIVLERVSLVNGSPTVFASSASAGPAFAVTVVTNTSSLAVVSFSGVVDSVQSPTVSSTWTVTLAAGARSFNLSVVSTPVANASVLVVQVSVYSRLASVYGQFVQGAVQMMNSSKTLFATANRMLRAYNLGGGGSIDIRPTSGVSQSFLLSAAPKNALFYSGFGLVAAGAYPNVDGWTSDSLKGATPVALGTSPITTSLTVWANNFDFPVGDLPPNFSMPLDDARTILTATMGTSAGVLVTFDPDTPLLAGVTLNTPGRAYDGMFNFYDPDNFFLVSGLLYSGDAYLQNEARKVLEGSANYMLATGQLPHHFLGNSADPTYIAISGATQTGPNAFWIVAALQYAKVTGDYIWLHENMPRIELALSFLMQFFDPQFNLINAPGPLWIDVFIRNNYTSDTNVMMVYVLREVANAEEFFGRHSDALAHRSQAEAISNAINKYLWSPDDDHYVTQMNPDGSLRDFVDYDSNLLAIALGVAWYDRTPKILKRVDSGNCTHARATYVSEKLYDTANCYGGNTGDSQTTMGRIGWADGRARLVAGDAATFSNVILAPVTNDLFANTWLAERFDCSGHFAHNMYYQGYPNMLTMLVREVAYGIDIGLSYVRVTPLSRSSIVYDLGGVNISLSENYFLAADLAGNVEKAFTVAPLKPNAVFNLTINGQGSTQVNTDSHGMAWFDARTGPGVAVELTLSS
eukprot:TRINITY_DN8585_c0_g1_i2.p1 TRINITY_DN8585_c0_g1~~TRINITY_DN8585_c0_g1_i2.p1  ORF type:complete len:774 (+),score=222.62 TRINITY_DN8585_c0_g1_i2:59-2380(+)